MCWDPASLTPSFRLIQLRGCKSSQPLAGMTQSLAILAMLITLSARVNHDRKAWADLV